MEPAPNHPLHRNNKSPPLNRSNRALKKLVHFAEVTYGACVNFPSQFEGISESHTNKMDNMAQPEIWCDAESALIHLPSGKLLIWGRDGEGLGV